MVKGFPRIGKLAVDVRLHLKNAETCRLIRELAELTGENMTDAVTEAVRERLERVQRQQQGIRLSGRLLAIGRDCARHLPEKALSADHDALLYEADGLPQ